MKIRRTAGDVIVWFIETNCVHTIGEFSGQPLMLEEWQKEFVRDLYEEFWDERRERWTYVYQSALLGVPRGAGKALSLDTPIPTPSGWTTMGDIQPGEEVFDETGACCRVVAVTEEMFDRPCYRITFSDHTSIVADEGHEWPMYFYHTGDRRIVTTAQLATGFCTGYAGKMAHPYSTLSRQHVVDVQPVQSEAVKCIQVDSANSTYLAGTGLVPTHNSTLAAGIALAEMFPWSDHPNFQDKISPYTDAPRILISAVTRENAMQVWGPAADMVRMSPFLPDMYMANKNVIWCDENRGEIRRVSADGKSNFGFIPSFIVRDELHAWTADKHVLLSEALMTALAKRWNSRALTVTTAGHDKQTILGLLYDEALKSDVREDVRPGFVRVCDRERRSLFYWFSAPPEMPIDKPETWRAAHPASWIDEGSVRAQLNDPSIGPDEFSRQWLNRWTKSRNAWFQVDTWKRNGPPHHPVTEIPEGAKIFCAVDGGWSDDCTALVWAWQEEETAPVVLRAQVWGTREDLDGQYHTFVPGGTMDMELVRDKIKGLSEQYQVREVAYDPKFFTDTAKRLGNDGFTMVEFPRSGAVYDVAVTDFYRLVNTSNVRHDGDPVLASHLESTAAVQTEGSWKIFKLRQSRKIDACVASIMAVGRCRVATANENRRYAFIGKGRRQA